MKKIYFQATLAILLVFAVSCQKDADNSSPALQGINTLTAFAEEGEIQKTYLDANGRSIDWTLGEAITVFYGDVYSGFNSANFRCTNASGSEAVFEGSSIYGSQYYAVYPDINSMYKSGATCIGGNLVVSLNPNQTAVAGSFGQGANLCVGMAEVNGGTASVNLRNVGALIALKICESNISSITIKSTSPLAGSVTVRGSDASLLSVNEAEYAVKLTSSTGVFENGQTYYAVVLPGKHNFEVVYTRSDNMSASVVSGSTKTIARNDNFLIMSKSMADYGKSYTKNSVSINEVGAAGKFIELRNYGSNTVMLDGYQLYVNGGATPAWVGNSSCSIPAGGYALLGGDGNTVGIDSSSPWYFQGDIPAARSFYLDLCDPYGGASSAYGRGEMLDAWGEQNIPYNLSYSFSYVGSGFVYASPTPGYANGSKVADIENSPMLTMTEIDGNKKFIEIFNASYVSSVDLTGYRLRKARVKDGVADSQTLWEGTAATSISPRSYKVMYYVEDVTGDWYLQHSISDKKNAYIKFVDPQNNIINDFTRGTENVGWNLCTMEKFPSELNYSYSLVGGAWYNAPSTPGAANSSTTVAIDQRVFTVCMNEIKGTLDFTTYSNCWVELYNYGLEPMTLTPKVFQIRIGWYVDGVQDNKTFWTPAAATVLNPGQYLVVTTEKRAIREDMNIHVLARLNGANVYHSEDHTSVKLDEFDRYISSQVWHTENLPYNDFYTFARLKDGVGDWYYASPTRGYSNGDESKGTISYYRE